MPGNLMETPNRHTQPEYRSTVQRILDELDLALSDHQTIRNIELVREEAWTELQLDVIGGYLTETEAIDLYLNHFKTQ